MKKVALVITIALLSGCAGYTKEEYMTLSPHHVCLAYTGNHAENSKMAYEAMQERGITCDMDAYARIHQGNMQNSLGLMAVGNSIANSSRPQSNPLVQCVQVANGVTNCQKVN